MALLPRRLPPSESNFYSSMPDSGEPVHLYNGSSLSLVQTTAGGIDYHKLSLSFVAQPEIQATD